MTAFDGGISSISCLGGYGDVSSPRRLRQPSHRWLQTEGSVQDHGTPDEAAAMAVFIASEEAGSFTGQDVNTPGG